MKRTSAGFGALIAGSMLLASLTACTSEATDPHGGRATPENAQSIADACAVAVPVTEEIDASQENMLKEAVENPDMDVGDVEALFEPLRERISSAEALVSNEDVEAVFSRYSDSFDSLADLVISAGPALADQAQIDAFTAELVDRGSRMDEARNEIRSLCGGTQQAGAE